MFNAEFLEFDAELDEFCQNMPQKSPRNSAFKNKVKILLSKYQNGKVTKLYQRTVG